MLGHNDVQRPIKQTPQAWAISLNPKGGTYAGTTGSGNVNIYSASPDSFGVRQTVLSSGRNKHGMACKHVRPTSCMRYDVDTFRQIPFL